MHIIFVLLPRERNIMDIHSHIKYIRKEMGLTQEEFAGKLGLKRVQYNCIERGRCAPTISVLGRIAAISDKRLLVTFIDN